MMIESNNDKRRKLLAFCEGTDYGMSANDDRLLADIPKEYCKKEKNGQFHFSSCGFMVLNDTPVIIFPKNFTLAQNDTYESIIESGKTLFKTFVRYRSRKRNTTGWKERYAADSLDKLENNAVTNIDDILYILEDFKRNGYMVRRHDVVSQSRPGRVVWSKTMHRTMPIISHGQVMYPSPYMKSHVRHDEEMVQKIHRYLVAKFRQQWGWLMDLETVNSEPVAPCTDDEARKYLTTELRSCFVQREIDLIRHMLRYYMEKCGKDTNPRSEFMLTTEFEQIWEDVCGAVFGNVRDDYADKIVPQAKFTPAQEINATGKTWHQTPDILCRNDNHFYVLDAKYYPLKPEDAPSDDDQAVTKIRKFPGWADMVKQFVYFYTIRKNVENHISQELVGCKVMRNLLLFPGSFPQLNQTSEKHATYVGDVSLPGIDFGNIELWWLDVRYMLNVYVGNIKQYVSNIESFFQIDENGTN